mmetsp:Transcript_87544/g.261119  ORF Transcript_87544/g.261119 Transcript_87544/m.261119 type:complete len:241 (-) Transcript_87544:846-1568(-)
MDVHRVLQLLGERFDLGALLQELPLELEHLLLQVIDVRHGLPLDLQLALQGGGLDEEAAGLLQALLVCDLALLQGVLLDLDLLVKERQLVVPPNELRAKNVALADDLLVLPLLAAPLGLGLVDARLQLLDLALLRILLTVELQLPLLGLLHLILERVALPLHLRVEEVVLLELFLLLFDLLLQLLDLVVHDFELPLHFRDLVLRLHQVLGVQIPVGSDLLIELLLLGELALDVSVVFLEL